MPDTNIPNAYLPTTEPTPYRQPIQPKAEDMCGYRYCSKPLPDKGATGPRKTYCSATCRRRERHERDKEMQQPQPSGYRPRALSRKYQAGDRFGSLTMLAYAPPSPSGESRALWRCMCGVQKIIQVSNVVNGRTTTCASRITHPDPRSKGPEIGYSAAHQRVLAARGPAKDHRCAFCPEPARDWAYGHGCPDERADQHGKEAGRPYSPDPDRYLPACRAHHGGLDRTHRETGQIIEAAIVTAGFTLIWATRPTEELAA